MYYSYMLHFGFSIKFNHVITFTNESLYSLSNLIFLEKDNISFVVLITNNVVLFNLEAFET